MPTKSPYTLGPGELRIDDTVIEISGSDDAGIPGLVVESDDIREYVHDNLRWKTTNGVEFECSINVDKLALYKLTGIYDWLVDYCPNRRVAHLIKHGKTKRVRYKNLNRALRIVTKTLHRYLEVMT